MSGRRSGGSRVRDRRWARAGCGLAVAALLVTGCSGGGASDSGSSGGGDSAGSTAASGSAEGGARSESAQGTALSAGGSAVLGQAGTSTGTAAGAKPAAVPPEGRRQVRTGDLSVQVKDVTAAAARVRSVAAAASGFVGEEKTVTDPQPPPPRAGEPPAAAVTRSTMTLRVPEATLDTVMGQVAALGTLVSRGQSSTDVSATYVDTQARLRSQRESVDRVRALLDRADTIGQVVQVEGQLAARTAELEALEARLKNLADQTTLATLRVDLAPLPVAVAATVRAAEPNAFVRGLRDGADALAASTSAALVVLGALLPFAVVVAVVGVPLWVARRRRAAGPRSEEAPAV